MTRGTSLLAVATLLTALPSTLGGCNALTGAGEPEIVDEGGGGGAPSSTGTSTATAGDGTTGSGGAAGGGGDGDRDGTGGAPGGWCGDGAIGDGESCDDGNLDPGDGCDASCRPECGELEVPRPSAGTCLAVADESDDRTWDDARDACRDGGGDLAVVADLDLAGFDGRVEGRLHVGARRTGGELAWLDGTSIDPADVADPAAGDCLALDVPASGDLTLVAVPCATRLRYLCERAPTGE